MSDTIFLIQDFILTLLLGGLIGLERQQDRGKESEHGGIWGIRSMALTALLGYIAYFLFSTEPAIFAVITAVFSTLVIASYIMTSVAHKFSGATTEVAALFVYLIGVLMAMGQGLVATIVTLIVVGLLYFKETLHGFALKVEEKELYSTLQFVAVVFVVLPLLPNQTFGPLDVLNPYVIWLMVVLISTISFLSYIAIKFLGPKKGIGMSGFLGGLISSTAVSMSFSELSKKSKKIVNPFVFGVIIASSAMFFRVLIEVSVLNQDLLALLYAPMLSMGAVGLLLATYFWFSKKKQGVKAITEKDLHLKSPFQLWPAIQFGLLFAFLLFISKFASITFGDEGLYLTALISGMVDVDAITVSMANLSSKGDISLQAAATAVTIATMTNTLVKGGIVMFFGSRAVGIRILGSMIFIIIVGLLGLAFIPNIYGFIAL